MPQQFEPESWMKNGAEISPKRVVFIFRRIFSLIHRQPVTLRRFEFNWMHFVFDECVQVAAKRIQCVAHPVRIRRCKPNRAGVSVRCNPHTAAPRTQNVLFLTSRAHILSIFFRYENSSVFIVLISIQFDPTRPVDDIDWHLVSKRIRIGLKKKNRKTFRIIKVRSRSPVNNSFSISESN